MATELLHGFSDAIEAAFGAAVYLKQHHYDNNIATALVIAKARVKSVKKRSIPQLELEAAKLLIQLIVYAAKVLEIHKDNIHTWTDCAAVLGWLRKMPCRLQTFQANRVAFIQEQLPTTTWRYVPTTDNNPADLPSRGMTAQELVSSQLWWHGPQWLANSQSEWPPNLLPEKDENIPGLRDTVLLTSTTVPATWEFYRKFSSYHKIVRVTATVIKAFAIFKSKLKNAKSVGSIDITQDDLSAANTLLIKLQQLEVFFRCGRNSQEKATTAKITSLGRGRCHHR